MKERSPKFPFIPLAEALENLEKLKDALSAGPLEVDAAISRLGYAGPHGSAVKVMAAMAGYGLLDKQRGRVELTETGKSLLGESDPGLRQKRLQQAALSPPMFLRIWRRARHLDPAQLEQRLLERGFTEGGAKRASEVYAANSGFAKLNELEMEPDLPEVARRQSRRRQRQHAAEQRWAAGEASSAIPHPKPGQAPALTLPLSQGVVRIPTGITEEDFDLLVRSLHLWKSRLIGGPEAKAGPGPGESVIV